MRFLRACAAVGVFLCVLLPQLAAAAPARTLRFEQLSTEQGLSQESVLAVVQDSEGFMWFGTQGGLSRFDGYRVTVFKNNVNDPRSIAANWVRVLHVDRKGRMWVGTDGGLDLYEPSTRSFRHFLPKEPNKRGSGNRHIKAIIDDGKGNLWLGSSDGLQHFNPDTGEFKLYHRDPDNPASLSGDQVTALALDRDGRLWVGTNAGLDMLAPGAKGFEHIQLHGEGPGRNGSVNALMIDLDNVLWIGKQSGLESRRLSGPPAPRSYGAREGLKPGSVTVLYQDVDKNVWVGTYTDGLHRWQSDVGYFARYRHLPSDPHSVADNYISALYRDRVGTFWVGTWYAGVSRVDLASGGFARIVRQADQENTLVDNKVRTIIEAGHGKLWVGTNEGLNLLDPTTGEAELVPHKAFLQDPAQDRAIAAVVMDKHGALWIGNRLGVSSYHPGTGKARRLPSLGDADSNTVRNMYIDRSGMLWIASRGGLHRVDPDTHEVRSFRHDVANPASLSDNMVRPILEDRRGRLWVGTFNGLELLDRETGKFRHFHHDPKNPASLSNDEVHAILEDSRGALWVGTAAGLNKVVVAEDGTVQFQRITSKDGLADDAVASILEDEKGLLWISTNTGIARIEPKSGRLRNYSAADGTIEGAYFDGSALRGSDGTLYFGGFNGITAFQPRAINDNLIAPRAIITDFQIFNKPVNQVRPGLLTAPVEATPEISLAATDSVFSLEFSALHYASPAHNRFAYQLEGFDETWVQADAGKRFATYTNLDPGTYVFRVKASNKDGVWGATAASMTIHVQPPYWKTLWFRAAVVLLVLSAAYAAYRFRIIGLRRAKSVLEAQVRARVDEIEQKNHQLERQARELQARREDAERERAEAERRQADAESQKSAVEVAHRNISTLSEIGREMTATLDMETIMGTVYRHVHHLMDARIFGIGLYNEETREIEFPFSIDQGVRNQYYTRSLDNPNQFAVWCLVNRRNVFINDLEKQHADYIEDHSDANMYRALRVDGSNPSQVRAMMYVPLVVKDKMLGVMCVQSTETDAYRRVHLDMLQTLAAYAAVALDNARAYQELEETQRLLLEQEKQVRLHTEELALANRALQENDERLRLAKQKAEDATRQKSEFLANMSHEMRTPLAGVIGMLSFALRDTLLQDTTREQMLRAQANAQALLAIINDLLDFSKIEAGKLTIENIDFDLNASVENVSALFEEQAGANSVDFEIDVDPALPRYVVGDPTRLRQVLVNLVGNAFKFTNDGVVRLKVERMPGGDNYSKVRFSVQDTGIGIAPDALARLFQKFEQADSTTTRRYGGTGLGLAICRQLVELMGGQIWVESKVGEGSTFTFELPLADGVEPQIVQHMPRQPHTHRLRVLCAEDFPTNQIIVRMLLEEMGHRVDIAENGALAVAACVQARYDLILMDGRMPEMDGATATRIIRSGGNDGAPVRDQELMIIALTANASEEDRNRYLAAGMDDFLTKPIDENALHFQISKAIERQLQRGFDLPLMSEPAPGAAPSTSELDAMFGVVTGPTPLSVAAAQNAGRRASDLKARMRAAFANDLPNRRADLDTAVTNRDHESAGRLLHGIKGSAAYLDATELHLLCGELEVAADGQQWGIITSSMPRLNRLLGEFETSNQD